MPVASCNQRNHAQKDSISRRDREVGAAAPGGRRRRDPRGRRPGRRYLYFARASSANLVGLIPHFFSSSWITPDLCHSAAVLLIMSLKPFSPCLTARPHGTNRI